MTKVNKIFKAFKELLKRPSLINLIINNDIVWGDYLKQKHSPLTSLPIVDFKSIVTENTNTLKTFGFLGGGSLPTDLILLKALCAKIENCKYFEIGTWRGESVVNLIEEAEECYTLNLSEDEIINQGYPASYAEQQGFFSKKEDTIIHLQGNSLNYDFAALNKKFDLIFIDGNHKYDFVKNDTEKVFINLVHKNSIVVWHDYAHDPESIRPEVLAGILDGIPADYKKNLYHVSNTKCAVFSREKLPTIKTDITTPNKIFETQLVLKNLSDN